MRTQVFSVLLMLCAIVMGQENSGPDPLQEALQVFPVSPEAASLGKYGDIPVNLASGKINYTVPIYTINVGGFEWPIYLSYNYGGLMAEQDHPMAGMGWDLIANGRVTKQVRGIDDDFGNQAYKASTIIPYLQGAYNNLSDQAFKEKQFEIYDNIANKSYDAEQDKYMINATGLDGSFVFNEVGNIVFVNHKNYKIEKNNDKFKITNDRGVNYYFDIYELGTYTYSSGSESVDDTVPMSYLLTQIELPNNQGSIYFDYGPGEQYGKKVMTESQTWVGGSLRDTKSSHKFSSMSRHNLQKIRFPNGEVRFNISSGVDHEVATQALNEISVWNQSKLITKYNFTYDKPTKNRKTLQAITKSSNAETLPWYQFDYHPYHDTMIFSENYKRQDFWGFYNGLSYSLFAEEGKAIVPEKTIMGALKKITYPTKGTSEILYEQNRIDAEGSGGPSGVCSYSHNKTISGTIRAESGVFDKIIDTIITVPANQIIRVSGNLTLGEGAGNDFIGTETDITFTSSGTGCENYDPINLSFYKHGEEIACEPGVNCPDTYTEDKQQLGFNTNGQVRIQGRLTAPYGTSISLRYSIKYEERSNEENNLYKYVGGIRVVQTKDCDGRGNCKTKTYKYIKEDGSESGGISGAAPGYQYNTSEIRDWGRTEYIHKVAKSLFDITSYQGSPVIYPRVEIWEENGENGKTVNYYSSASTGGSDFPFVSPPDNNHKKGRLVKSEIFKKVGDNFVLQQETVNQYANFYPYGVGVNSSVKAYGMAVGRHMYRYHGEGQHQVLDEGLPENYSENYYVDYPKDYQLVKTTTKEFLQGKTIINATDYVYDNPYGQLKTQTVTDSKTGTQKTTYFYPYNKSSTVNNKLVAQNRITIPIETKNEENGILVATQATEYIDWGNNIILPGITKTAKGTDTPQARVTYHKYDAYGNPLEVSQPDGRRIMYIWGYNNIQPIAKIDNASYSGIPSSVTTLINQLQTASNTEDSAAEENSMRNLFHDLRTHAYFAKSQITGYTYDPLIGVTSITDPKEQTAYYKYDDFNRLQYVLDQDQAIAQQTRYNYEGQGSGTLSAISITSSASETITPNRAVTFTAAATGASTNTVYTWSINGVQEQCNTTPTFSTTFAAEGNYAVSVVAYDAQTKQGNKATINVSANYPTLSTPSVSASHTYVTHGTNVTYTASGVSGGSESYRYEWYVNNTKQSATGTTFQFSSSSTATYDVYFKLIDTVTGRTTNSAVQKLYVYPALTTPSVSINTSNIVFTGTTVTFTAGNIGGGSGNRRYEWYINNTKQSYTGTTFVKKFDGAIPYTVKFKVIDTTIPSYAKEKSVTITVYNRLNYPNLSIESPGGHIVKGTTVTVNGSYNGGGSGNYRYEWRVNDVVQSYTGTKLVKKLDGAGSYTIKFRVIDKTIPGHFKENLLTIKSYNPLNTPSITANKAPHIVKGTSVTFTASGIGSGSGSRRYEWYVDGIKQNGKTANTFTYNFPSKKVYNVKFRVIDTKIAPYHYKESNTIAIYSHNALNTPSVAKNHTDVLKGRTVTFTAGNIGNGSGSRKYKWYVNGTPQGYTGTQFSYTPNSQATYTIKFEVIDNNIPSHSRSRSVSINAYNPLNTPGIANSVNRVHIVRGTSVKFTGNTIGGGSGQRRYEWYLNGVKQSATGTSFTYRHMTKGSYQVKFKVIDTRITSPAGHSAERVMTMYAYDPMVVSISPASTTLTNSRPSVTFRINSVTGGTGDYTRTQWKVWRMSNPSWTRYFGTGSSYTASMSENGEYELSVKYTDNKTKQVVLKTMPIIVSKSSGGGGGGGPIGEQH